jgi:hypothetical protein
MGFASLPWAYYTYNYLQIKKESKVITQFKHLETRRKSSLMVEESVKGMHGEMDKILIEEDSSEDSVDR